MNETSSLHSLGIEWKSSPRSWNLIPIKSIPKCDLAGKVFDLSGNHKYTLYPIGPLGGGQFGIVDAYSQVNVDGTKKVVAIKRPNHGKCDVLIEGLFQWKVHNEMKKYNLGFSVPEVYGIVRFLPKDIIWIIMEAFQPYLLSTWCIRHLGSDPIKLFCQLMLQIAIVLEAFETKLKINHRDLKADNILIVNEKHTIIFTWNNTIHKLSFPFRVVFVDFGFACLHRLLDIRTGEGLPPLDACPKQGRDILHVLVSIWNIPKLRSVLNNYWGEWIREKLKINEKSIVEDAETEDNFDWLHDEATKPTFSAPHCAPAKIINECLIILEQIE